MDFLVYNFDANLNRHALRPNKQYWNTCRRKLKFRFFDRKPRPNVTSLIFLDLALVMAQLEYAMDPLMVLVDSHQLSLKTPANVKRLYITALLILYSLIIYHTQPTLYLTWTRLNDQIPSSCSLRALNLN